jgi:hypothetical protein
MNWKCLETGDFILNKGLGYKTNQAVEIFRDVQGSLIRPILWEEETTNETAGFKCHWNCVVLIRE